MLAKPLDFTGCSSIQFLNSPLFPYSPPFPKQSVRPRLVTSKNTLPRVLIQKLILRKTFSKCSLKKSIFQNYIFKIVFSKNINFISVIYSSSESSEELSKSSIICLTNFFLNIFTLF